MVNAVQGNGVEDSILLPKELSAVARCLDVMNVIGT